MQRNFTILILLGILTLINPGCSGAKKMAKRASELEMSGMFKEAAELYYFAAIRKPDNVEFKSALRRAGAMYVEDVSQEITASYNRGEYQKVVYDYLAIDEFINKVKRTGVDIPVDNSIKLAYDNAQNQYLNEKYDEGLKLLGEKRYAEAKTVFEEIHKINHEFRDTRTHLNTATLEPLYQNGTQFFSQQNYMGAYREWARVTAVDPNYKDTRQRMQNALNERYKEGTILLMNEDFHNAAVALGDVFQVNPSYQDVRKLFIEAQCEPLYRQSIENMRIQRCRESYMTFLRISEISGGEYKDSGRLRAQALECASYPIAIHSKAMPGNTTDRSEFESSLMQNILNKQDPFIKIHLLPTLNNRVSRSILASTGAMNRAMLKELHDRQGIKAVLALDFIQYEKLQGNPKRVDKKGIYREASTSEQGITTYNDRQVNYTEYSNTNKVVLTLSYQLISTNTGEVLLAQRLNTSELSDVHYVVFEGGEHKNLYPTITQNGNFFIDERNYSSLQRLLAAEKSLTPVMKLKDKVFVDLTNQITDALVKFNPER
jgi:tetratricopeptide (TPR) repeat protein